MNNKRNTSKGFAPGEVQEIVDGMTKLYRGPSSTVTCPDCRGTGRSDRLTGAGGGHYACGPCSGTGRVPA